MKKDKTLLAIVIPVYIEEPKTFEKISLKKCFEVLKNYPIIFVSHKDLDLQWYKENCSHYNSLGFEIFDTKYFSNIQGYNSLLISSIFYERFINYKFILIYQLDSYIFSDNLIYWCRLKYDYIGAPWINLPWLNNTKNNLKNEILSNRNFFERILLKISWISKRFVQGNQLDVGNGGFSLRNVVACYNASLKLNAESLWKGNEDIFWGMYVPLILKFKIPTNKTALKFSFDANPKIAYKISSEKLPMGCHSWYRTDHPYESNFDFWKDFINIDF